MIWLKVYHWNLLNENFLFVELTIHQKTKYLPLSNGTPKQETEKVILLFFCPESGRKEGAHLPCPHCKITIIKRSNNESAVSAAAYQSGEKLFSEYDQEQKYYPYKNEVTHKEILLPPHAPPEFADRNTLWNSAEAQEKQWNSQLARRLDSSATLSSQLRITSSDAEQLTAATWNAQWDCILLGALFNCEVMSNLQYL